MNMILGCVARRYEHIEDTNIFVLKNGSVTGFFMNKDLGL